MDAKNINYTVVNLDDHPDIAEEFKTAGIMAAPIMRVGNQTLPQMTQMIDFIKNFTRT